MFFGLHERQLDDKGRVALPATFRDDLGERCVLVFGDSRCIEVHAADAFEARAAEVRDDVKRGVATMARQRALAHSATPVSVDRQGRITVEERLREFAHLSLVVEGDRHRQHRPRRAVERRRLPRDRRAVQCRDGGDAVSEADFAHEPVMVDEIVTVFGTVPPGTVLDATLGGGGHAEALLDRCPHLSVLGLDRDEQAIDAARQRLRRFGKRVTTVHSRFDRLIEVLADSGIDSLAGALFDLGVSSPQLDHAERGFSYRNEGPLDMRMDPRRGPSAADVVNGYDEADLARVIRDYGDERFARRIARAIVAARPITTTTELAAIVTAAIPAATRRTGGHPAKRTFQALRIEVNSELDQLPGVARPGDRRDRSARPGCRADLPLRRGPARQAALRRGRHAVRAPARRGCRACAERRPPCAVFARRARRRPSRRRATGERAPARLRVVEKLGAAR